MGARRFLFEVVPDLMPFDHLTDVEAGLWGRFMSEENEKIKTK